MLKYAISNVGLATPIEEIQEIVRPKTLLRQEEVNARSTKYILGFFNLREEKVLLYDLPDFLGLSSVSVPTSEKFEVIIASIDRRSIGFKVNKVHGIIHADELMPFPEIVRVKDYFRGVVRDDGSFLQVLSFHKLMSGSRLTSLKKFLSK